MTPYILSPRTRIKSLVLLNTYLKYLKQKIIIKKLQIGKQTFLKRGSNKSS